MTREELQRLERIRGRVMSLGEAGWELASEGSGMLLDAAAGADRVTIARFQQATTDEMQLIAAAPGDLGFLLDLVDRAIEDARRRAKATREAAPPKGKDFAAEATMKCGTVAFRQFLAEQHGLDLSGAGDDAEREKRAVAKLRSVLGISSRSEMNRDGAVADRWRDLRGAFEAWRRAG
ncbi:MAG: hypothetical protein Rhirs2KO_09660 [Rhizobiaceae bacterium]